MEEAESPMSPATPDELVEVKLGWDHMMVVPAGLLDREVSDGALRLYLGLLRLYGGPPGRPDDVTLGRAAGVASARVRELFDELVNAGMVCRPVRDYAPDGSTVVVDEWVLP